MTTVGVIGLGQMGHRMSERLLEKAYDVVGYDVRDEAVARLEAAGGDGATSPADVAERVDVVLTSLPTPETVEDVFCGDDGLIATDASGFTVLEASTSTPETTRALAAAAAEEDVKVVDAPVSGGIEGARAGTLTVMVGADEAELGAVSAEVLDALSDRVYHLGDTGSGNAAKLVNNVLTSGHRALAMEAMALGTGYGVNPNDLFEIVSNSAGSSIQFEKRIPRVLNRNFEPGFALDLSKKDVRLALRLADDIGYPMELTSLIHQRYKEASAKGYGDEDACAIVKVFEECLDTAVEAEIEVDETYRAG